MAKKNLGNAELVTSMASSDNYLIETGGSIRRVANANVPAVYDSDGNVIVDTYQRKATTVVRNWSSSTDRYIKFASRTVSATASVPFIAHFHILLASTAIEYSGAFIVNISTANSGSISRVSVVWETLVNDWDASNIIAAYSDDGTVELWCRFPRSYQSACITLVQAGRYNAVETDGVWTFYTGNASDEKPTEGYTQVVGTLATLQNPVSTTSLSDIQTLGGVFRTATPCLSRRRTGYKVSPSPSYEIYSNNLHLLTACA